MISRNQQRNWETLLQLIGLRCLPEDISMPVYQGKVWRFSFSVDTPGVLGDNDFDSLYRDCRGVPMIVDLSTGHAATIETQGSGQNIWFSSINI
jgi:hypothetical protein